MIAFVIVALVPGILVMILNDRAFQQAALAVNVMAALEVCGVGLYDWYSNSTNDRVRHYCLIVMALAGLSLWGNCGLHIFLSRELDIVHEENEYEDFQKAKSIGRLKEETDIQSSARESQAKLVEANTNLLRATPRKMRSGLVSQLVMPGTGSEQSASTQSNSGGSSSLLADSVLTPADVKNRESAKSVVRRTEAGVKKDYLALFTLASLIGAAVTILGTIGLAFVFKWRPHLSREYELIQQEMENSSASQSQSQALPGNLPARQLPSSVK